MNQFIIRIRLVIVNFTIICMTLMLFNCATNSYQNTDSKIAEADVETLESLWLKTPYKRNVIIREFESRKSIEGLAFCLQWATTPAYRKKYSTKDAVEIINALGRIRDPKAISAISNAAHKIARKDFKLAVLIAYKEIGSPQSVIYITKFLHDPDPDIRFQVLDTLGKIKTEESMKAVFVMLFDTDANIRWKAVHTLGEIGNPQAAGRIGFLLADPDNSVRGISENVLIKLGIPKKKIADWRKKADQLSIDEVYRTKVAYQKAEIEKQELVKKLESEKDLKKELEESFKNQEVALGKQQGLIESLYEKERQLKSKQAQLQITLQQSKEYQVKLQRLNAKVQSLNAELKQAKTQAASENVKQELDKTLAAKFMLEQETKSSQEKQAMLRDEISSLNALAEQTRLEAEAAKKEIIALRNREKQLAAQVDELKQRLNRSMAPVLVVSKPENGITIESPNILLHFIAVDDKGISQVDVTLNGNPMKISHKRGLDIVSTDSNFPKKIDIIEKLQLKNGKNIIKISVVDTDGLSREELIHISKTKARGDFWAIIIGINQYQNTRNLKYAVNDAQAFKDYLIDYVGIPDEKIFYLADQEATKLKIESLLGTTIKRKASIEDTVIIFYAGHGAVEPDPSNLDGDGFEKYLLPYDANLTDLYSTSISMNDIRTIFMRIRAERLIFIADTCYSGASGGRTMMATKTRANLSDKFYERISKGKGRVIISSCSANEISKEDDDLQHGIFSYYMLEGLKGRADQDGDSIITVSELFSFISRHVPQASGQDQHPVKKGETEGELVIGRTK